MGANFFFDQLLPTVAAEAPGVAEPKRQLELFTHDGRLYLRIGPVGKENSGGGRYTVELSEGDAAELASQIGRFWG